MLAVSTPEDAEHLIQDAADVRAISLLAVFMEVSRGRVQFVISDGADDCAFVF